jgi:uncharacterized protein (TIGR02996 family)
MNDREALLAAIVAESADDTARLAFADWLDEDGDPVRAKIIRVGVANPSDEICALNYHSAAGWSFFGAKALRPRGTAPRLRWEIPSLGGFSDPRAWWIFRRGFLTIVRMTYITWVEHANALLQRHPIDEVRLTSMPIAELVSRNSIANEPELRIAGQVTRPSRVECFERLLPLLRRLWPRTRFALARRVSFPSRSARSDLSHISAVTAHPPSTIGTVSRGLAV